MDDLAKIVERINDYEMARRFASPIGPAVMRTGARAEGTLKYVSLGPRPFGNRPYPINQRPFWEIMAVVRGKIAPMLPSENRPALIDGTLWVHPPGHAHGWIGEPSRRCRVVVFNLSTLPPEVEKLVERNGFLVIELSPAEQRQIQRLARELLPYFWSDSTLSRLYEERARIELALLILRKTQPTETLKHLSNATLKVEGAERCFRSHLAYNMTLSNLAGAVGVSVAHLRRLFLQVRRQSPMAVMHGIRMQAALEMLNNLELKLDTIAGDCGFSTANNFGHAFKALKGVTPGEWRRRAAARLDRSVD